MRVEKLFNFRDLHFFWKLYKDREPSLKRKYKYVFSALLILLFGSLFVTYAHFAERRASAKSKTEVELAALTSLEAYNQYFQGRNYWNRRDEHSLRKAIGFFNKATHLDPTMAQAYSGIADCYAALGYGSYESPDSAFLKAEAAALRALQLDTTLADAHTSLGYIRFYYYRDWAGAEKEFTKAIQSDPHYDAAFDSYSYYLTALGRFPEAGVAIERALQINPLSAQINTDKGFFLYYSGHYEEAVRSLRSALDINPKNPLTHLWLGRSYQELKMYKEAIPEFRLVLGSNKNWPVALAALGYVYGIAGQQEKAAGILDTLLALDRTQFVTPYGIALLYLSLNNKDKTFDWLEKAYVGHSNWLVWLKLDPRWLPVRQDRRYNDLLARVGLVSEKDSL